MPRGIPPKHSRWKKGQSGNPEGGRAHNPAIKRLKKLTNEAYADLIEAVAFGNGEDVRALACSGKAQNLIATLAHCWMVARRRGDYETIEKILSRVLGKIPDEINLNSRNLNANVTATLDMAKVKAALKELEEEV